MPTPAFVDAGAGQATTSLSMAVAYPSSVASGDFLVLQVYDRNTSSITTPTGWTSITSGTWTGLHHCYYKVADGTESGSLTVAFQFQSPSKGKYARIYRFTGGGSVEAAGIDTGSSRTVADRTVTTTGAGRLAVNLVALSDDLATGNFTGMSGGTWAEATPEYTSTVDSHATLQIQTAAVSGVATINGGTTSVGLASAPGSQDFAVMGFAIVPATIKLGLAVETDTPFPVTATKGVPGLRAVLGRATETDTALPLTVLKTGANLDLAVGIYMGTGFADLGSSETSDSRVRSASVTRGRPFNLDVVEAGTVDLTLNNGDGYLDPTNADGPWYGNILPVNPIRVFRRQDDNTYPLFTGVVESYTPVWQPPNYQDVQVQGSDSFDTLSSQTIVSGTAALTTAFGSNKDLTFTATTAGENGDDISVTYAVAGASTPLSTSVNQPLTGSAIIQVPFHKSLLKSSGGFQPVGQSGPPAALAVTVSGSDITINLATSGSTVSTSTANDVLAAMQANPDITGLISVALATGSTGAGTVSAMAQTNLAGGKWPSELTGARINRVLDLVGWDTDARAIDDGTMLVAERGFSAADNTSALSHIQEVADAELGYFFMAGDGVATYHDGDHRATADRSTTVQAVFSDDGTGFSYVAITPALDIDRIVNSATVTSSAANAVGQTAQDLYSQSGTGTAPANATNLPPGGFGKRDIQRPTQLAADADALTQAQTIVDVFAYPYQRFDEITTFEPDILTGGNSGSYGDGTYGALAYGQQTESTAWVAAVLALEIGDLITVRTTPPAINTTTSFNAYVEQITDNVSPGQPWARTLKLSPLSQSVATGGGGGSTGAMLNSLGGSLILDDATNGVIG